MSVDEVGSSLKSTRPIRGIKVCIVKEGEAGFDKMPMTTFRYAVLLWCMGSGGVVSDVMSYEKFFRAINSPPLSEYRALMDF